MISLVCLFVISAVLSKTLGAKDGVNSKDSADSLFSISTTDIFNVFSSTTDIPCDPDDYDDWRVDYIGKSTQFRIYNPCDDDQFLKIKMTGLTEYDSNGKKTRNKVTGFASTDWSWWNADGVNTEYNGYKVIKNTFTANNIIRNSNAGFELTTYIFKEDAVINNNATNIDANSLKWNVKITDWPFENDNNHLELCINLMTNGNMDNSTDDDSENGQWKAGEFEMQTFDSADCGNGEIGVNVTDTEKGSGENQRNFCFTFGVCTETEIFYDPIVTPPFNGKDSGVNVSNYSNNIGVIAGLIFGVLAVIAAIGLTWWFVNNKKRNAVNENYQGLIETEIEIE
eukprot:534645_1